ncbi:hypothetical protein ECEC1856_3500, partial [Escherichia coli EC1856]
VLTGI